ncbi:pilus assembly protein [Pasteurella canis]|uniref:TadE/TadG family type IV pilus assembly protein n=1 Tax=Pasteurella canis TaxID=753 RepID=UPI001E2C7E33|nr:TadE/TadG family type IV pilus assembly protein [Pasteurella canis]UEA17701.1 pilus assembly protein [Pasteurella canis]
MKKFYFMYYFFNALKRFYVNEQGVYAVMTALLAFPLLVLVGFTVDGTGVLLDKARLAQGMDQAALALIAENNSYRENKTHDDVKRQRVTKAEKDKFGGNEFMAQQDKRNQELIQGMAKLYLRSEGKDINNLPVTVDKPFQYKCEELDLPSSNQYARRKPVFCQVQGGVNRQFWLPVSESLPNRSALKEGRLRLESQVTYALKEKGVVIPIELMLVADFSGSMLWDLSGNTRAVPPNRKIDILQDVVKDIQGILFPNTLGSNSRDSQEISPFNRMGFVTFAAGARQRNEINNCVFPYYMKEGHDFFRAYAGDIDKGRFDGLLDSQEKRYCENTPIRDDRGRPGTLWSCKVKGNIKKAFERTLYPILLLNSMKLMFDESVDIQKTIDQVKSFNGSNINYDFIVRTPDLCLGGNNGVPTTRAWFTNTDPYISPALNKVNPKGGTATTSGLFVGTNLLMDTNKLPEAQPKKLGTNVQRILMVLSDGEDNRPSNNTLTLLLNNGLCNTIREKADSLQDATFKILPTRIAFVAFGFNPPPDQVDAWKKCVGEQYYHANSKKELLETFKQIIGLEEEVGRSSSKKPKFN